jgi:hypothetical protein
MNQEMGKSVAHGNQPREMAPHLAMGGVDEYRQFALWLSELPRPAGKRMRKRLPFIFIGTDICWNGLAEKADKAARMQKHQSRHDVPRARPRTLKERKAIREVFAAGGQTIGCIPLGDPVEPRTVGYPLRLGGSCCRQ